MYYFNKSDFKSNSSELYKKTPYIIALIFVIIYFIVILPGIFKHRLLGLDEAQYAAIAGHAAFDGHWLPLEWKGKPFYDKPPFFIWVQAIFLKIAGKPAEWPIRLPALVSACVMWFYFILLIWHITKDIKIAVMIFLLTAFQKHSILYARSGTLDMALLACIMAVCRELAIALEEKNGKRLINAGIWCSAAVLIKTWFAFAVFFPALAILILDKNDFKKKEILFFFILPVITMTAWIFFNAFIISKDSLNFEFGYNTSGRISGGGLAQIISGKEFLNWQYWTAIISSGAKELFPIAVVAFTALFSKFGLFSSFEKFIFIFFSFWFIFLFFIITPYINYILPLFVLAGLIIAIFFKYDWGKNGIAILALTIILTFLLQSGLINDITCFIFSFVNGILFIFTGAKDGFKKPAFYLLVMLVIITIIANFNFILKQPDQNKKLAEFAIKNEDSSRKGKVIWVGDPMKAQILEFYSGFRVIEETQYPLKSEYPLVIELPDGNYKMISNYKK